MSDFRNIFLPALGGACLVLGVAYGLTARTHRSAEIDALTGRVAQLQESAGHHEAQAKDALAKGTELEARIAELEAALAEQATQSVEAEQPEPDAAPTQVAFGNADAGAEVFKKCASCHSIGAGAEDRVGPHLNGIFGRRAGLHDGFNYSQDLRMMGNDGLVWELDTLDAYLENPKALVSRTRMNFGGLKNPQDRADILAFLRVYSDDPQNIPEASPTAVAHSEVTLAPEILALEGDLAYGEYLSAECTTCHQTSGSDDGIPAITGWPTEDFVVAMHAYKEQIRPHPVMQMMAARLSNEEIAALAAFFETLN